MSDSGVIDGGVHRIRIRVYYEDTDAAGIVYHAAYLEFAERARTELLRCLGLDHATLRAGFGLVFTVRRCSIDYRAPARLDLLAGNIQGVASTPDFEMIAAGKAWLVGSMGTKRWKQTANVPTFAEDGYPDLVAFISWGFSAPAGTPDDIIRTLNAATNKALKSARVLKIMEDNAYFPVGGSPDVLTNDFNKEIAAFSELFKAGLIKLE